MKELSYIILLIFFIGCKADETTTPQNDELVLPEVSSIGESNKIEIVTWNIERFPKTDLTDDYVKAIIEKLNADIFILQEIQSSTKFATLLGEISDYDYFLQTNSAGLNFAIVYNNQSVNIKNTIELFPQDDHYFAGRPPLLINISWQNNAIEKELSIINVHYKCCGDNSINDGDNDDEEYRRLKANELLEQYISDNLQDANVIIGGDFNDAINEPDLTNVFLSFLSKPSEYKFVDMDIATGDPSNWSWPGWSSSFPAIHFDHIIINRNLFDEFAESAIVEIIKLEEYFEDGSSEYDLNVSDHRPLYFKFSP